MRMFDIEVSEHDGGISISQDDGSGGTNWVVVTADQAPLLCEWILGLARSLQTPLKD